MNNNLEKISVIKKEQLSSEFYFQSLLEQGHIKGILTDSDIERLQYECLSFLAYKVERFNAGDSSSIQVEKAQNIMASNMFTIGLWLKTYQNPDDAVTAIKREQIAELYQKGREHIDAILAETKAVHAKVLGKLVNTKNDFYRLTIEDAINGFFKRYYPDFAAHEIHITADYPTFNTIPKLAGIEFIHAYLNALYRENQFCFYFDPGDIHHLLRGYEEDYQELLINIYEPILLAALGCVIAGTDVYRLDISEGGAAYLYHLFNATPKSEIFPLMKNAVGELTRLLNCPHELIQYIQNSLPMIISRIETAVRKQTLDRVFVLPAFPENRPQIIISFGDKMEDEQYRKVIEEIGQCRFSQDKITIIKEHIHSLADFEDILLDADLIHEEVQAVLRELSFPEIAALSKRYLILSELEAIEFRDRERLLRKHLNDFVFALPEKQRELIAKTIEAIEIV